MASRVATALINRTSLPQSFCVEVKKKISEMIPDDETVQWNHENHDVFKQEHDQQLLLWLNR